MTVEEYIDAYTRHCSNEITQFYSDLERHYHPWLTSDHARNIALMAREEEWKYMEYQLELRLPETLEYNGVKMDREDFIKDILKAMKDDAIKVSQL